MNGDRELTIVVKTFQRPESLLRLVSSIRPHYPEVALYVVDDSEQPLDPVPDGITRYWHEPFNSLGVSAGRNFGLRRVETEYVLFCDDDMVFERRTDLAKMLSTVVSTPFDVVSCMWMDHEPWRSVRRGFRRYEGTLDVEGRTLVHRLGATRGAIDGLPVFDIVHQFFVASVERLGPDPWNPRMKVAAEHVDFFLGLKERGLLSTRLPDVVVHHYPQLPPEYFSFRADTDADVELLRETRGFDREVTVGRLFRPSDRLVHELPGTVAASGKRAARVTRRLLRERRLRA
jgi:glycosyltransferase involved in cell wall biosynthesis